MARAITGAVAILMPVLLGCITDPGIAPATDAGRGTVVIWERNGLHAAIFLDYHPTGRTTPDTIENIPAGTHTIHLFYKDYATVSGASYVDVREKRIAEAEFEMQKYPAGGLVVKTEPPGAVVSLNNIDFGPSPLSLEGLPAGSYTVNAALGNYRSSDTVVEIAATASPQVDLRLKLASSVVIEYFSNTDCPGCPAADAAIDALIASLPQYKDRIHRMTIHANWPAGGDPFYTAAPGDCKARVNVYNVANDRDGLPAVYMNGAKINWPPDNAPAFIAESKKRIDSIVGGPAAAEISFTAISVDTVAGDSLRVTGTLSVKDTVPGHELYIALIEDFIGYALPPGTNGQRLFNAIFRGFSKDADGIAVPESGTVSFSMDIALPSRPPYQFSLLAFLQDRDSRIIVQSQHLYLY